MLWDHYVTWVTQRTSGTPSTWCLSVMIRPYLPMMTRWRRSSITCLSIDGDMNCLTKRSFKVVQHENAPTLVIIVLMRWRWSPHFWVSLVVFRFVYGFWFLISSPPLIVFFQRCWREHAFFRTLCFVVVNSMSSCEVREHQPNHSYYREFQINLLCAFSTIYGSNYTLNKKGVS